MGAYSASKWGLRGLAKYIAMEVGPFGIRVNSIHPSAIDLPMLNPGRKPVEHLKDIFARIFLSCVGHPAEVAREPLVDVRRGVPYLGGGRACRGRRLELGGLLG